MPLRRPAEIRKLTARARKVADTARGVSPTGRAFAELVDELVATIGELRDELNDERRRSLLAPRRPR
ncbi:MAG TPA: hypothetical protein VEC14_08765 [Reyranellaceae bacterium]|nr:hypothetical protein [Reyranellaceae bacterium]